MTAQTKAVLKTYFETGDRPTQAQFGDLIDTFITTISANSSGAAGQIPDQRILANITGASATPTGKTLTNLLDTIMGAQQGAILHRGGAIWQQLGPGAAGQLLSTNGSAANPSWITASGTGTVTSVSAGSGLTASTNPIVGTGDISLAQIPNNRILANSTGASAAPTSNSLTTLIDSIGSAQGTIIYRGAASWSALAPGTSGQFLKTNGAAANPAWSSSSNVWTAVFKTADEGRSTVTFSDDAALTFAVAANTKYQFKLRIFYNQSNAGGDLMWRITGPAAPTLVSIQGASIIPGGSTWNAAQVDAAFSTSHSELTTTTGQGYVEISGILQNGANSGNVTLQWAMTAANGTTTIRAGSLLEYATVA